MKSKNSIDKKVGVVLVNWNSDEHTIECIDSLLNSNLKPDHIIVIDNASHLGSPDKIKLHYPEIELIRNKKNLGFTGANNIGINILLALKFDYIWILNNDTLVDKQCLSTLKNFMNSHPESAAVSGIIFYENPKNLIWYGGAKCNKWTLRCTHNRKIAETNQIEQVPFISGCCMFIRRETLEQVGNFDDHFFAYAEDGDWCYRARKNNLLLFYNPEAIIWHKVSASVKKIKNQNSGGKTSPFLVYITNRNRLYLIRKHADNAIIKVTASIAVTSWILFYASALLCLFRFKKLRALFFGIYDGILNPLNDFIIREKKTRFLLLLYYTSFVLCSNEIHYSLNYI